MKTLILFILFVSLGFTQTLKKQYRMTRDINKFYKNAQITYDGTTITLDKKQYIAAYFGNCYVAYCVLPNGDYLCVGRDSYKITYDKEHPEQGYPVELSIANDIRGICARDDLFAVLIDKIPAYKVYILRNLR